MISHTSTSHMNTLQKRGKSRGWAAVDLSEKQKHGLHDEADRDPYPPIATLHSQRDVLHNNGFATKSFSNVLQPSMNFPSLAKSIEHAGMPQFDNSEGNKLTNKKCYDSACKKLKDLHGWADNNLIEDIITAVDGDINLASSSLKEMDFTSLEETKIAKFSIRSDDHQCATNQYDIASVSKNTDLGADISNLGSVLEDALKLDQKDSTDGCASSSKPLAADAASNIKLILGHFQSIPVESEWEEDDVYLSNRKSALRVMRTASHHSRAATNAFLRGDHYSAQQHSLKARHEWLAAERLNVHAAKEILSIRNSTNDPWKLDLHGLHKAEAIQVLQEHLKKIESQICINQSVSRDGVQRKNSNSSYLSLESPSSKDVGYSDKQANSSRVRPTSLQVITGVGNHSRGPAALPIAVRSFLDEKGYHYDDSRPGVIVVWPTFRQR